MNRRDTARLPSVRELEETVYDCIDGGKLQVLEAYLEDLKPALTRAAAGSLKSRRISRAVARAYEEIARLYAIKLTDARDAVPPQPYEEQAARRRLGELEAEAFSLAARVGWSDMLQRLSYVWGRINERMENGSAAERFYRSAVAFSGDDTTALHSLESLASLWKRRDLTMAAFFYRWAAEFEHVLPAVEYAHLYCCLVAAGKQSEVLSDIQACDQQEPKSVRTLVQLAAARQALGMGEEAEALWQEATQWMLRNEPHSVPGLWERRIQQARAVGT